MNNIVKISLVGDIFPSDTPFTKGFGYGSIFLKDFGRSWEVHLKKYFIDTDITFGNLEVPLIEDTDLEYNSFCAGSKFFAKTLRNSGFNIVSIANNHILEQGSEGFINTQNELARAGVNYVGVFNNYKSNIVVLEKEGLKFGFAAFNSIKDIHNPNLHADLTLESIKNTIDEMNSLNIDFKLLSFHWGNEYINIPSYNQIELAHSTIDYGADVIIGHHPHVIQPIENYKNGIIIYSLGNFIFDFPFSKEFKLGMLVEVFISIDRKIEYKVFGVHLDEKKINSVKISSELNRKLNKYASLMGYLLNQSPNDYKRIYNKKLRKNHLYQRIMMKIKILELLIISKHRKLLVKNIFNEIRNTF